MWSGAVLPCVLWTSVRVPGAKHVQALQAPNMIVPNVVTGPLPAFAIHPPALIPRARRRDVPHAGCIPACHTLQIGYHILQ